MKIAISSSGPSLNDMVDPRFGRAAGFVIADPETAESSYLDNGQAQMMGHGAGIQAAETIARSGAKYVLTGSVGPKAFQALSAAGIKVVQNMEGLTVAQAIERFRQGELQPARQANRGGR